MNSGTFDMFERKVIIRIKGRICETAEELFSSELFRRILNSAITDLVKRNSMLLGVFDKKEIGTEDIDTLAETLIYLTKMPGDLIPNIVRGSEIYLKDKGLFAEFIEYLYNYWRSYDRFIICDSTGDVLDKRPYRTFNATIEQLTHLIRGLYRDIEENITMKHPSVYRQVRAGAEIATISLTKEIPLPSPAYYKLNTISIIRQILLYPPLILNPPMNKRTGEFVKIGINPLDLFEIHHDDWLCYPAKVGSLLILIYFHNTFSELGFSLSNLFKLADDEDLKQKPDAVYTFGVPGNALDGLGIFPTVFFDDEKNDILVAAVPGRSEFGYFGYLKKMVLTLHNIKMMKTGKLPFHGAFVRIILHGGKESNLLIIGDTGAGKSETLEAFRELGGSLIQDMIIIADDMGSLDIDSQGNIIGYGTEIGAFLRLDDLKPGYAFGQIDRAIIMSPTQVNARIVLPVTTFENVIKGHRVDYMLYANNYEEIDADHPVIELFDSTKQALTVFREGTVMSKGTTTSTGIVHSYFANIFGPPQYRVLHEAIAQTFFETAFESGVVLGQMRTRLGIAGMERKGPEEAAKRLIEFISSR